MVEAKQTKAVVKTFSTFEKYLEEYGVDLRSHIKNTVVSDTSETTIADKINNIKKNQSNTTENTSRVKASIK